LVFGKDAYRRLIKVRDKAVDKIAKPLIERIIMEAGNETMAYIQKID
jgi:hypothetical protein